VIYRPFIPVGALGHLIRVAFTSAPGTDDDIRLAVHYIFGILDDEFLRTGFGCFSRKDIFATRDANQLRYPACCQGFGS
jgi:hypothetical protein